MFVMVVQCVDRCLSVSVLTDVCPDICLSWSFSVLTVQCVDRCLSWSFSVLTDVCHGRSVC